MAPLQSLIADARSTARACVATLAVWAMVLGPAGSPMAQGAVPGAPDVPGPAAEAAAGAEAEGEAPAPPKLVLGVPPKFPVTPAVEKAVHDIDEVMQWFMSSYLIQCVEMDDWLAGDHVFQRVLRIGQEYRLMCLDDCTTRTLESKVPRSTRTTLLTFGDESGGDGECFMARYRRSGLSGLGFVRACPGTNPHVEAPH